MQDSVASLTGHLLAESRCMTPFSASSKKSLARWIWPFMNLLHLSVTFPLNISSSVRPACASSSSGRYILPLLELQFSSIKTKPLDYKLTNKQKQNILNSDRLVSLIETRRVKYSSPTCSLKNDALLGTFYTRFQRTKCLMY